MLRPVAMTVNPLENLKWDAAVDTSPETTFFHGATWARILTETYGFTPLYLNAGGERETPVLLPLMEVNSCLTGRRGVALPFTDECPPVATDEHTFSLLFQAATNLLNTRRWRYLELRGGERNLDTVATSAEYWGHEIPLGGRTIPDVFANCSKSVRGAIRSAEKSGLVVEAGSRMEDVKSFYTLLCQTRRRHGNPPQPIAFFERLYCHAIRNQKGLLLLAKHGGRTVAGAIFLHSGCVALYKYAASDTAFRHLSANNLILWRALEWYIQRGYSRLQLGRTSVDNEGLRHFKRGWGGREYRIKYFRYARKSRDFVRGADRSSAWHTRIFRLLPQTLSRHLGALAYKHIA